MADRLQWVLLPTSYLRALLDRASVGEAPDDLTDEAIVADTRREIVE